jgi:hypothetical protein
MMGDMFAGTAVKITLTKQNSNTKATDKKGSKN